MRNFKTLTLRLLLGAALFAPLTLSQVSMAELELDQAQSNDQQITLTLGDRKVIVEAKDGAQKEDLDRVANVLLEMVNGSPAGTEGTVLSASARAEALINAATANETGTIRFHVFRGTPLTALAAALKKPRAEDEGIIEVDVADFDAIFANFENLVETRDQAGGTPKAPAPEVVALAKRLFFIDTLAHELGHTGTNLDRVVSADGSVVLTPKPGTTPSGNNFPDPRTNRTPLPSPQPDNFEDLNGDGIDDDKGHAVTEANAVIAENLEGTGLTHVRRQYFYVQAQSSFFPPVVYDLTVTARQGEGTVTQAVTMIVVKDLKPLNDSQALNSGNNNGNGNGNGNGNSGNVRPPPETFDAQRNRRRDRSSCGASNAALVDSLLEVPQFETDPPITTIPGVEEGEGADGGTTDGAETEGSDGTDTTGAGTEETGTDGTTGADGSGETDASTDSGGQTEGSTGGGNTVSCVPDSAGFGGDVVPQAGVEIDFATQQCQVVSGFPPQDLLVIDDFGDGGFAGSGSGLTVIEMDGGSFSNEGGFYFIDDLVQDAPISITFENDAGVQFTVSFTIDTTGASPVLSEVSVTFDGGR